ncbi:MULTISPECIES: 4-hydroxy-3-methylbut-2-enyl diphosphate reductase [Streptomyces]|uniref:4-hydroxy-3-methylbut-2-enyl diphosphate reductase n=2 Tax=Streptomyces TaxID=1883 RepID=A0ABT9LPR3_STRGD|nr:MULTISPECIES: 4-hydroxy-3-methylbut-2-enyl diphosphate reductase [Streptomyces]MDP9685522.1 4-hydroxy-3-methylbut-2-enyl diphosphate reductase [Streptomyces griseoviridis]GGS88039.1 4-hydroxy-3-methylbut-2-enyl diphosphate reductase [Streptomyces griseoviridis]GGU29867.1 4-hydroxy-3-methylbut-2-enyl diphosphate reductase [Streptomyces daghestanicus]GHI33090.1 4-hydroxy-3-methylbut-2-enyl diphosphate reductase [Streptomyces daghestanicus]
MSGGSVVLAEPRGFCAGVRRAIGIVERALDLHGAPVYVRKEIVHNQHIVSELEKRGAVFVDSEEEVPHGAVCVFSAHGVSPGVRSSAAGRGLDVIDATCPLVSKVHQEAVRFTRDGRTVLLVGHEGHEEVEGVLGEAPDRIVVIETEDDVRRLGLPDDAPVAVLTQTTLSFDETERVVAALRARFTDLVTPGDDICYASQNRQSAVKDLARANDLVLIVGSRNSSNSLRMVEVARDHGAAARLVPDAGHLDAAWLEGVSSVGVSAGASAPEVLVDGLVARLAELGFGEVAVERGAAEDVVFSLPGRLADPVTGRVPRTPLAGEPAPAPGGV